MVKQHMKSKTTKSQRVIKRSRHHTANFICLNISLFVKLPGLLIECKLQITNSCCLSITLHPREIREADPFVHHIFYPVRLSEMQYICVVSPNDRLTHVWPQDVLSKAIHCACCRAFYFLPPREKWLVVYLGHVSDVLYRSFHNTKRMCLLWAYFVHIPMIFCQWKLVRYY